MNRNVSFNLDGMRFNYRLAGVVVEDGYVLLHRFAHDDFWALPGGRCELGEPSKVGIVREFQEELSADVRVERLLWTAELFFDHQDTRFHELDLVYKVAFEDKTRFADKTKTYIGIEGESELIYQWFPLSELDDVELYPVSLRKGLQNLPETPQMILEINNEPQEAMK